MIYIRTCCSDVAIYDIWHSLCRSGNVYYSSKLLLCNLISTLITVLRDKMAAKHRAIKDTYTHTRGTAHTTDSTMWTHTHTYTTDGLAWTLEGKLAYLSGTFTSTCTVRTYTWFICTVIYTVNTCT